MSKIIVVYKSKTGFTQRYGELIAQKLGCEAVPYDDAEERLAGCDTVVFYMQSGLCYEKMPFSDRIMMKIAGAFVTRKRPTAPEEAAFQHAFTHSHDIFSQEYATPLIDFLRAEK